MKVLKLLALVSFTMSFTLMASGQEKPNIIFIFSDDLGWGDLGCYGHNRIKTPNIDRMARDGMRLTNFYVSSPVCSPSRTAVMTGQYPARHRIHRHLTGDHQRNDSLAMDDFLDPNSVLLTRLFQQNGYRTGHFGKWHLGHTKDAPSPGEYGIDVHYTATSNDLKLNVPRYQSTQKMVDEAIAFIEESKNEPFYINVWTLVPHANLDPSEEQMSVYDKYAARGVAAERGFSTPAQIYYSAVTDMDENIGRLMKRVEDLGLSRNTIFVFSSDNGPEDIHIWNAAHSGIGSPGPLRGRKRSLYDGGVRVPFIIKWEGHTPENIVNETTVMAAVDLLPTFCNLAGIKLPADYKPDGEDLSAIFAGEIVERTGPLYWEWTARQVGHHSNMSPSLAMRLGNWKFLMNPDQSRKELYDFSSPRGIMELDNVANEYPDIVSKLSGMLLEFKESIPEGYYLPGAGSNDYNFPAGE